MKRDHAVVLCCVAKAVKGAFGAPLWVADQLAPVCKSNLQPDFNAGPRLTDEEIASLRQADDVAAETGEGAVYGQLIVLGYKEYRVEGSTWHPVGARNEKFALRRRDVANGIRRDAVYLSSAPPDKKDAHHGYRSAPPHSVTMSVAAGAGADGQARVRAEARHGRCTLYAAGFNNERDIFLSEQAPKWQLAPGERAADAPPLDDEGKDGGEPDSAQWDALTTFGVRIWKPEIGAWREVSVHGGVHEPRARADVAGKRFALENSTLTNGTIVDLAGIQLLYESAASMRAHERGARRRPPRALPRASRKWASLALPDNAPPNARYRPICPFCAKPLKTDARAGEQPFNRILFQSDGGGGGDDETASNEGDGSFSTNTPRDRTPSSSDRKRQTDDPPTRPDARTRAPHFARTTRPR
ncbi:hypothetical protein JL722_14328 [Aureococcus anophagefferens]|nr:hypothetical protein JL722_14328 [Aureococcus anophagefferens]